MVKRQGYIEQIKKALGRSPIVSLLGPRQCGKTTLAKLIADDCKSTYFDLESQKDLRRLENPEMIFASLTGLAVIDEIQKLPGLFAALRVVVDKPDNKCKFLILGSASPNIIKNVSETLAGRVEFVNIAGFTLKKPENRLSNYGYAEDFHAHFWQKMMKTVLRGEKILLEHFLNVIFRS
jgi:uncharacterized protein